MKCIHCIKKGILFEGEYYCETHLSELCGRLTRVYEEVISYLKGESK